MKKIYILLLLAFVKVGMTQGQTIPNAGFEDWETTTIFEEPDSFSTSNYQTYFSGGVSGVKKTIESHSGNACRIETIVVGKDTVAGMLLIGTPGIKTVNGGIPFSSKPDSIFFYIKYDIKPKDTALLAIGFKKNGQFANIIRAQFYGQQNVYKRISLPLQWNQTPDSLVMILTSSNLDYSKIPGSYFLIDGIELYNSSQPFPNGNFEHWNAKQYETPVGWNTINTMGFITGKMSAAKDTSHYEGKYALRLETIIMGNNSPGGYASLGPVFGNNGLKGGIPISLNPEKVTWYYKYIPVGLDTGLVMLTISKWDAVNKKTIYLENKLLKLAPQDQYTFNEYAFTYQGLPVADTFNIIFASGNFTTGAFQALGSVLYVDNINMTFTEVNVKENTVEKNWNVFPNPAKEYILFNNVQNQNKICEIFLFDYQGRQVFSKKAENEDQISINVQGLKSGIYFYSIHTLVQIENGKLIIE